MNQQEVINEIRRKNDIVDIIGERIPLVSRGKNYFGVCPFHDDNHPSMSVSREKQIYTCFSCHATGNVFTFLMHYEHKEFAEVLHDLAERSGVELKGYKTKKVSTKYDPWYQIYEFACKYYQNNLMSSKGKEARAYLEKRKLSEEVIREFEIGFSLEQRSDLTNLLVKKGYSLDVLNQVGLTTSDYDIFHQRLMFPLHDLSGHVVGFSGRIIFSSAQNKYLNTKETELFKKGRLLYHYHIAKEACRIAKYVLVMEGFMDVIRSSSVGIKNTVATMGTALTKEHIADIKRLSNQIILCFDGDEAGQKATVAAGELFTASGVEPLVLVLPQEEDPDTFILQKGKEAFLRLVENAEHFHDYRIRMFRKGINFDSPEEKALYIHKVLEETAKLTDPIRIEIILKELAKNLEIGYNTLEKTFQELKGQMVHSNPIVPVKKAPVEKKDKYQKASYAILYYMLTTPWVIEEVEKEHIVFPKDLWRALESEIVYFYHKYGFIEVADFYTYLAAKKELLSLLSEIEAQGLPEPIEKIALYDYFKAVREYNRSQEIKRLEEKMKEMMDPLEQAKVANEIRELRIGENETW